MCRASALFVGVYEPAKQKLLRMFPENLSAFAHLVRYCLYKHKYSHTSCYIHFRTRHILNTSTQLSHCFKGISLANCGSVKPSIWLVLELMLCLCYHSFVAGTHFY